MAQIIPFPRAPLPRVVPPVPAAPLPQTGAGAPPLPAMPGPQTASPHPRTLAALFEYYLSEVLTDKAPQTQRCHAYFFAQVLHDLGDRPLEELTPAVVRAWKRQLETRYKPSTVHRYMTRLAAALRVAVEDLEWLPAHPMRKVKKPHPGRGRERFLTAEERQRLLAACQASSNRCLYPLVVLALSTGGRREELRCLRWEQVNVETGVLALNVTKRHRIHRVPVRGEALEVLRHLAARRQPGVPWVFPNRGGQAQGIKYAWQVVVKQARLEGFRFHDLRHTCASYLVMSGASLRDIAEVLGHAEIQETMRYSHLLPSHTAGVLERMTSQFLHPPLTQEGPPMYERLDRDELHHALPFPLNELPLDGQPIRPTLFPTILGTLLRQSAGLAGVIYTASCHPETCEQDVTQALHVLSEWLNCTLAVWRRWVEERHGHPGTEDGG